MAGLQKTLVVLLHLFPTAFLAATPWGSGCSFECQCYITPLSQTIVARWVHENRDVRAALCVLQRETSLHRMFLKLPPDTETLVLLQAPDTPTMLITEEMIVHPGRLKVLDVQGISILTPKLLVAPDVFRQLTRLQHLSLLRVKVVDRPFTQLRSLLRLQVTRCDLGAVPWDMLEGLDALNELELRQNGIKKLDDFAFYGTPNLKKLSLSHNEISQLHADTFAGLLNLEVLDLSHNKLDSLSDTSFPPLPSLHRLELKHNPLVAVLPNCFMHLNSTQRLGIGDSRHSTYLAKFGFRGLESLVLLSIPNVDNDIIEEHTFYGLHSLRHLSLQGRTTVLADRAFHGAHKTLDVLVLHHCQLLQVHEDAFHGLSHLTSLDLSSNKLASLPEYVFEPLESLQELILSHNKFHKLPEAIFDPLHFVKSLRLDANPWNCTCLMAGWKAELAVGIRHLSSHRCPRDNGTPCLDHQPIFVSDPRVAPMCEEPPEFKGQNMFDSVKQLQCHRL